MGLPPTDDELFEIFMPYAFAKLHEIERNNTRFVHYTSAAVARSIVDAEKVWMRQSRCMNDFMEVEYGFNCLSAAMRSPTGERFRKILDENFHGCGEEVIRSLDHYLPAMRNNSYLTCISEHEAGEDEHGRLSMWRAYGGNVAVALVLNNAPFLSRSTALNAFTSPVGYLSPAGFMRMFEVVTDAIEEHLDRLRLISREEVLDRAYNACMFAILCTKHPGFHEELEWRVIHCPDMHPSRHLERSIETVNGVPQPVYKIPLKELPDEGFEGASIPNLIDRIIIGPCDYPGPMQQAFVSLLEARGVSNPETKVVISGIPLR